MKVPNKFVKISQGPTTIVYILYGGSASRNVKISHREVKPAIFRVVGRKFDF